MSNLDLFKHFVMIFNEPPQKAKFYNLRLDENNPENQDVNFNDILIQIFINGIGVLFGTEITPATITKEQFDLANSYIHSFGYNTLYEIVDGKVNIWFEKLV